MKEITHVTCYTLLCVLVVTILHKLKSSLRHGTTLNLPPGPWALPIIGNIHCLVGSLPHQAMQRLSRRYGPVMLLRLGDMPTVVVSSPEAAREVAKTHDVTFASRPVNVIISIFTNGGKNIAFAPYGEHWKELHRICTMELLSPKRVQSFRSIREREVGIMVESIVTSMRSQPLVNVSELVRILANDIIVTAAMGTRFPHQDVCLERLEKALEISTGFNLVNLFPSSRLARVLSSGTVRAAKEIHENNCCMMEDIIQDHMRAAESKGAVTDDSGAGGKEDLLGVLLRLQREGALGITLSTEIVSSVLLDAISGGSETTATTLSWAMSELMRNPCAMERAQFEVRHVLQGKTTVNDIDIACRLHYLQLVIKETLRLHPPVPLLLPRLCAEPCKVASYDIPQGTTVLVNAWAIGRDEKNWANAEEFRPERFEDDNVDFNGSDFRFLPGGSGRRICPGLLFGLANVELALASLLYHFNWKLPDGVTPEVLDMTESSGMTAHRRTDLWLKATSHIYGTTV